jgi:hypothetical protein
MARTVAIVLGIVYALMGVVGFFSTGFIGPDGFFASNALYAGALVIVGALLLVGAFFATERIRTFNGVLGAILVLFALAGFLMVPDRGTMIGMLIGGSDHWLNLILGVVLLGSSMTSQEPMDATHRRSSATA